MILVPVILVSNIKMKKKNLSLLEEPLSKLDLLKKLKTIKKIMIYMELKYNHIPIKLLNIFNILLMKKKIISTPEQEMLTKMLTN